VDTNRESDRDSTAVSKNFMVALALLTVLAGCAALAGCTAPADHPALKAAQLPPLIQAHRFAYRPDVQRGFQLSPDGRKLAWIGPHYLRSALFVRNNDSGKLHRYRALPGSFQWTPDSRRLLTTAPDTSGAENTHIYMLDTRDPDAVAVDLTPYPGVKARIHLIDPANPAQLLVYHNHRDKKVFDVYGNAVAAITNRSGKIQGWQTSREALRTPAERSTPRAQRQPDILKKSEETYTLLGASADGSTRWALSDRGRERIALVATHPTLQWEKVIYEDPHVDVSKVTLSRVTGAPLIAYAQSGLPQAAILNVKLREDLDGLMKAQGNGGYSLEIVSTDNDEKHMVIAIYNDAAQRHYLLDRPRQTFTLLAEDTAQDADRTPATLQPVTMTSRDGLPLHGYLTLPPGVTAKGLPMVLLVHGGPWMRTGNPYRSTDAENAKFLANRGYVVLQVDFRGSVGYGKQFQMAAIGEFAGKMHDDLLDAVRWAVDKGIADPARVAISGWSYGGYAALVGLTMTPETFACGISLAGPTDLATLIEAFPPYWTTDLSMWKDYVGDPAIAQDREEMTRKSPLTHAAKVQRPVLIVHGAKDVRVRIDQSQRMVDALKRAGKPVEYLPIADMGHGADWWVHRLAYLRTTEDFLHRCLGGRASRFDPFDALAWGWQRISK
jgi:dipeptidyl aminopeptidase/acylaminoacyl peptidase